MLAPPAKTSYLLHPLSNININGYTMGVADYTSTVAQAPVLLKMAKELKPRSLSTPDCFAARVENRHNKPHAGYCVRGY